MPHANVQCKPVAVQGEATCIGGRHPDPPLDDFPLLVWCPDHHKHGSLVFTEDGAASVHDVAVAACETPNYDVLAAKFGTTAEHAAQAVNYALKASFLKHE